MNNSNNTAVTAENYNKLKSDIKRLDARNEDRRKRLFQLRREMDYTQAELDLARKNISNL